MQVIWRCNHLLSSSLLSPPILLWQRKTDYGTSPLANATQDLPLSVRIAGECSEEPYPRDNGEKHLLQKRA